MRSGIGSRSAAINLSVYDWNIETGAIDRPPLGLEVRRLCAEEAHTGEDWAQGRASGRPARTIGPRCWRTSKARRRGSTMRTAIVAPTARGAGCASTA